MLTADGMKLRVFEDFEIDNSLPKHRKRHRNEKIWARKMGVPDVDEGEDFTSEESDDGFKESWGRERTFVNVRNLTFDGGISIREVPSRWAWLSKLAFWRKASSEPEPTMTIQEFFTNVKLTAYELHVVKERAAGYESAMLNARQAGQRALYEQLNDGLNAFRMETHLVAMGLTKCVYEDDIVGFYKQCQKGLRLDWVRNFTRIIPPEVTALKVRADELGLFDNYVVLHYDPEAKSYAMTQQEKEAKRDPILFGLMKGRSVLYVVGDWVDEVCDLTLDQFADAMGGEAIKSLDPRGVFSPYREK